MENTTEVPWFLRPSRRINIQIDGCRVGFSVPLETPREDIINAALGMFTASAFGRGRRVVNIDGDHTLSQRLLVVWSYVESFGRRLWLATFGKKAAQRKVDEFRVAIEAQLP